MNSLPYTGRHALDTIARQPILDIQLFADLGVQTPFGPFPACLWRGERSRALLCYLAYRSTTAIGGSRQCSDHTEDDTVVPRADILHALWPDQELRFAQAALHKSAYLLRQAFQAALGPAGRELLISRPAGYALCSRNITVDVAQFKQAVFEGRWAERMGHWGQAQQALCRAVKIYSDDLLLEDYNVAWVGAARTQLRETFGETVRTLATLATDSGQLDEAEMWWHQLLELNPADTMACRHLMDLYMQAGRNGAALRIFRQYQQRQDQQGLDPTLLKMAVQATGCQRSVMTVAAS